MLGGPDLIGEPLKGWALSEKRDLKNEIFLLVLKT